MSPYAGGKRIIKSFPSYLEALKHAKGKVRELAKGNANAALSAKAAASALAIRDALDAYRRDTGRSLTAVQAVTSYLDAAKLLPEGSSLSLSDAVKAYLRSVAAVERKPLGEAVSEFAEARKGKAVALPGKRSALNPVYVQDTERMLREFAGTFPGHHVCDLTKAHVDAYVNAHGKLSPKSRNHHRATLRMFLGWCQRKDYLSGETRLLEADGLRREPLAPPANAGEVLAFASGILLKSGRNGFPLDDWAAEYFDGGTWRGKPDWHQGAARWFLGRSGKARRTAARRMSL